MYNSTFENGDQTIGSYITSVFRNPRKALVDFKELLRNTSIEIIIGALLGVSVLVPIAHNMESNRSHKILLGFSEISQIERDAKAAGTQVGFLTRYLTSVNDAGMKVFECSNLSYRATHFGGNNLEIFARELEQKMDPALRIHHYELYDLLRDLPKQAQTAKYELRDFIKVRGRMGVVNNDFKDAWDDTHVDVGHWEPYEDSEGNTHWEWVYDYTIHSYNYDKKAGEKASQGLNAILKETGNLEFKENLLKTSQTNAEGEYAAETSRERDIQHDLSEKELLNIACTWNTGSTLMINLPKIYELWANLQIDAPKWEKAKKTAKSDSYSTGSHSDSGPKEFQIAEITLDHGKKIYASIDEIIKGIDYVQKNAPVLDFKVREFISVVLDKKPGNAHKLSKEIRSMAKDFYNLNFKKGFDVKGYRGEMIFLMGLLGAIAGGLSGFGVDILAQKYGWWGKYTVDDLYRRFN